MPEISITSADGTKLAGRHSGRGSPLVLVHGGLGDVDAFALLEPLLAEQHTVWVYSRRGRGSSGDGVDHGLDREVDDVLAVLEAAGGPAHLFGHSSGAFFALCAAAKRPALRSLLLYEPPLRFDRIDVGVVARVQAALDRGNPDHALETFFPHVSVTAAEAQVLRAIEQVWERARAGAYSLPREGRVLYEEGPAALAAMDPPAVPTLYLYGEETDAPIFPSLDEIAGLLPSAQLCGLDGQRHLACAFDPGRFAQAMLAFTQAHDR